MSNKSKDNSFFTKERNNTNIYSNSVVKVYEYKDSPYVTATAMTNSNQPINLWRKISKNERVNIETGEVRTYSSSNSKSRTDNAENIRKSQQKLVHLIRNNFSNSKQLKLHTVLTFAETVYDYDVAMNRWQLFRDRLKHRFPLIEFIAIFEYYEKGKNKDGIHIHLLLLPNSSYITRDILQVYWNYGFVYMKDFNEETATYFVKKNTLHLYPKGKRLYTKSNGIVMPTPKVMSPNNFMNIVKRDDMECIFQKSIDVIQKGNGKENVVNTISYLNYKKKKE